jgi:hypothetical protein
MADPQAQSFSMYEIKLLLNTKLYEQNILLMRAPDGAPMEVVFDCLDEDMQLQQRVKDMLQRLLDLSNELDDYLQLGDDFVAAMLSRHGCLLLLPLLDAMEESQAPLVAPADLEAVSSYELTDLTSEDLVSQITAAAASSQLQEWAEGMVAKLAIDITTMVQAINRLQAYLVDYIDHVSLDARYDRLATVLLPSSVSVTAANAMLSNVRPRCV